MQNNDIKKALSLELRRANADLSLLYSIIEDIAGEINLEKLAIKIAEETKKRLDVEAVLLMLVDKEGLNMEMVACAGIGLQNGIKLLIDGIIKDVFDSLSFQAGRFTIDGFSFDSSLYVPLIVQKKVIGIILVCNKLSGRDFTDWDKRMVYNIALVGSNAIENARLVNEFISSNQALYTSDLTLKTIKKVCNLIGSSVNPDESLDKIMDLIVTTMDVEAGILFLLDSKKQELFLKTKNGEKKEDIKDLKIKIGEGIIGSCVELNEPRFAFELSKDFLRQEEISKMVGIKTRLLLSIPIKKGGKAKGVIVLINKREMDTFPLDGVDLVSSIANLIGLLLEEDGY